MVVLKNQARKARLALKLVLEGEESSLTVMSRHYAISQQSHRLSISFLSVCCPYPLVAIPFVLVGLAVIFTWVSAFNCRFYVIRGEIINGNSTDLNVGIWTMEDRIHHYSNAEDNNSWYEDDDNDEWNCALWSEMGPAASTFELDAAMKAARFFSLTAAILSLVAFILILVPFCAAFEDPKVYMRILAGMFITIGLFVMLDLVRSVWLYL